MIAIIDYGLGNAGSVSNMLEEMDIENEITCDAQEVRKADKLILPGVGAFDKGMELLADSGALRMVQEAAALGKPILGICLGMQLLGRKSEEGVKEGLGLIPFDNARFRFPESSSLKIPHMGWDTVTYSQESPLTDGLKEGDRYYFVHSYHAVCDSTQNVLMSCTYGYEFAAAVQKGNIYGVQFHPEKSHFFGMKVLSNFAKRC